MAVQLEMPLIVPVSEAGTPPGDPAEGFGSSIVGYLNLVLGLGIALVVSTTGGGAAFTVTVALASVGAAGVSLPRGRIRERYGDWQELIR